MSENDSNEVTETKKKKKWYMQSFREKWLEDPDFCDWLQPDYNDKTSSYCSVCKCYLRHCNRSMLLSHKQSKKHTNLFAGIPKSTLKRKKVFSADEGVARAELLVACFFTEHQFPYRHVDHFIDICKNAFHDCKIARKIAIDKKKLAYLIEDGIAYHEKEELAQICCTQKFSVMIDENIDLSQANLTAVVVRFFDVQKLDIVDVLFDTILPDKGTIQDIYSALKMLFINKNIPLENIIGFGNDNCLNEVFSLLRADVPSVFGLGCDCHSFSLCFSHAIKKLPSKLESLLQDISDYFVNKGRKLVDFGFHFDTVHSVQVNAQELSSSRGSTYENIINVVLENWNLMIFFFQSESEANKVQVSHQIYTTLTTRGTKHMLLFLQYILQKVNAFNAEFQSEEFRIHLLHSLISQSYSDILSCFIDDEIIVMHKLSEVDPTDCNLHKNYDDIFLGGKAMALLYQEPLNEDTEQFQNNCLEFLIEFSNQIKQNFPIAEDSIIAELSILDPTVAQDRNRSPESISKLAFHFSTLFPSQKLNALDDQWKMYRLSKEITLSTTPIPRYWYMLRNIIDNNGKPKFSLLSDFMTNLSVLPHSSSAVDTICSQVNLIREHYPIPLQSEAVKDRFIARQMLARKNLTCTTWEPSQEIITDAVQGECLRRYEMRLQVVSVTSDLAVIKAEESSSVIAIIKAEESS
ncbi:hypothetical protein Bpfe_003879 [Biomphalaria pfeifferi]|uniref:DUF4371 domain-containing protein n=1 Tax=Biomphalaria pfeifferi TaxID=112525 RepID=A0AAD8C4R0_BIOPF|nr:hypothetical protein Bpfe_003879 [Biomphalaria pfeifferi]